MIGYSIAICTWNRAELLRRTLDSLATLRGINDSDVEVLVVNNASTDNTLDVLQSFQESLPLRFVQENQQGHCFARNRAVMEVTGDIILWTDDDVQLNENWLNAYREQIQRQPEISFWGGQIRPQFLQPPPTWLLKNWENLAGCYATRELGDCEIDLDRDHLPYGANFAVRRQMCLAYPFDIKLGRVGSGMVGEDERDFLLRLIQQGHQGKWVPAANLMHLIPAGRMTLEYIASYYAGQAEVQWKKRGQSPCSVPDFDTQQFASAAAYHDFWFRWTFYFRSSNVWLNHKMKSAIFHRWAELSSGC